MRAFIPKEFRAREHRLLISSVFSGLLIAAFGIFTRLGGYGGWVLLSIIGIITFLALGRRHRAFFVGVFGLSVFGSMSLGFCAARLFIHTGTLGLQDAAVIAMLFLLLVVAPVILALFITWIRRHEDPAA